MERRIDEISYRKPHNIPFPIIQSFKFFKKLPLCFCFTHPSDRCNNCISDLMQPLMQLQYNIIIQIPASEWVNPNFSISQPPVHPTYNKSIASNNILHLDIFFVCCCCASLEFCLWWNQCRPRFKLIPANNNSSVVLLYINNNNSG